MRRNEIDECAELSVQAFADYEYFTNWFPDKEERNRVQFAIIWREYKTNFGVATYLVARESGKLAAVFLLIDIRHEPSDNDVMMFDWMLAAGFTPYVVATKSDKVKRSQIAKQTAMIRRKISICG